MMLLTEGVATGTGVGAHGHDAAERPGERRRGLRIRQHRPVKVFEPLGARYFGGQTDDISATGLRVELPAFATVREGETLSIHVGLSRKGESLANRRQMLPARVVRPPWDGATSERPQNDHGGPRRRRRSRRCITPFG